MVEYKEISEYNIGDIVHIYELFQWVRVQIMDDFADNNDINEVQVMKLYIDVATYVPSCTIALTDDEYEDMQLEEKFKW